MYLPLKLFMGQLGLIDLLNDRGYIELGVMGEIDEGMKEDH